MTRYLFWIRLQYLILLQDTTRLKGNELTLGTIIESVSCWVVVAVSSPPYTAEHILLTSKAMFTSCQVISSPSTKHQLGKLLSGHGTILSWSCFNRKGVFHWLVGAVTLSSAGLSGCYVTHAEEGHCSSTAQLPLNYLRRLFTSMDQAKCQAPQCLFWEEKPFHTKKWKNIYNKAWFHQQVTLVTPGSNDTSCKE